jgi:hypothetical protein
MFLYKKTFPLAEGVSFSRYIKALNETAFPPYVLLIKKIPSTQNYHIEIILTFLPQLGGGFFFFGGALFNECVIKYKGVQREFTLNASIGILNFLLVICIGLMALSVIGFAIIVGMSVQNFFIFLVILIVILTPYILTYLRDIKLLKNIGSIAMEQL